MESVNCDLCGGASVKVVASQTDIFHKTTTEVFSIVRCEACGLSFTNPRPDAAEIGKYYPADYAFFEKAPTVKVLARKILDRVSNSAFGSLFSWLPPLSNRLAERVKPSVKDPVMEAIAEGLNQGLLDIGCGSGDHANIWGHSGGLMAYRKWTPVAGIEPSAIGRKHLASLGVSAWPNIESVPGALQWSVIRMNWSLEHVHQPSLYFEFMGKALRPGGRAIVCVPNYDGLLYRLAADCVELPIHLYHFTPRQIEMYAEKFGLRVRKLVTFSYPAMFFEAVRRGGLAPKFGANRGVRDAQRLQRALDRFDDAGFGNDIVAVLERPT